MVNFLGWLNELFGDPPSALMETYLIVWPCDASVFAEGSANDDAAHKSEDAAYEQKRKRGPFYRTKINHIQFLTPGNFAIFECDTDTIIYVRI